MANGDDDGFISQGYEGYGQAAPGLTPAAPWTTSPGFNWGALAKGLGTSAADANKLFNADASLKPLSAQVQIPQSAAGRPINAQGINSLLQMLNTRRDLYQQAAMNPQGGVPQPARPVGLLGY